MDNKYLLEQYQENPIAFHRIYSTITKGVATGLLFSQLMYWDKVMKHQDFYKTDKDFCNELSIGMKEFRNSKAKLVKLGLVETYLKGVPAKTYYKVNRDALLDMISSLAQRDKLDCPKGTNKNGPKGQTIYTENTSDITTEKLQQLFEKEIQTDNLKEKQKFISYWTEKNTWGKKERWQKQQVFDIKRRWATWTQNTKEWGKEEKKKPYFWGDPVVEKHGKMYVIENGEWKIFAGDKKDIVWK